MTWTPKADRIVVVADRPPLAIASDPNDPRWEQLRRPFPDSQVGHKPQPWCRACVDNKRDKHCERHTLIRCRVCGQRITEAHVDLDYIGHAAVTNRMLEVDPFWDWRPMTETERKNGGYFEVDRTSMWIWLDILGKVRPGIGETAGTQLEGGNRQKSLISDAIKNAAMRFGIGIQAWSKEDLADKAATDAQNADSDRVASGEQPPAPGESGVTPGRDWVAEVSTCTDPQKLAELAEECKRAGQFEGAALAAFRGRKRQLDKAPPSEDSTIRVNTTTKEKKT